MKYQIKWRVKDETTEQISPQVFFSRRAADIVCAEWNDLNPNTENWVVDVMEGPFAMNGDTIIPNPIKE